MIDVESGVIRETALSRIFALHSIARTPVTRLWQNEIN